MKLLESIFLAKQTYINGELTSGYDLAKFAKDCKDKRIAVLSQRLIIIGGQAKSFYITTN